MHAIVLVRLTQARTTRLRGAAGSPDDVRAVISYMPPATVKPLAGYAFRGLSAVRAIPA
jgi:hypothetical protein